MGAKSENPTYLTDNNNFMKTGNYQFLSPVMFVIIFWIQSEFFAEILPQIEKVTRKKTDICFQQIMVSNVFYTALLRHVIYIYHFAMVFWRKKV